MNFDKNSTKIAKIEKVFRISIILIFDFQVKTWKMHLFTFVQMCGLGILWAVKSSAIALAFPFFVVAMVPLRLSLEYLPEPLKFTPQELEEVSQL